MPPVKIQRQGFAVKYPKTSWRVIFVEDGTGKFRFLLCGSEFKFEMRDRYRSWEAITADGFCIKSQRWYKHP